MGFPRQVNISNSNHSLTTTFTMAEAPGKGTTKRMTASHNVPPPPDIERSKLDCLLQINEDYFEEQLRTVVLFKDSP